MVIVLDVGATPRPVELETIPRVDHLHLEGGATPRPTDDAMILADAMIHHPVAVMIRRLADLKGPPAVHEMTLHRAVAEVIHRIAGVPMDATDGDLMLFETCDWAQPMVGCGAWISGRKALLENAKSNSMRIMTGEYHALGFCDCFMLERCTIETTNTHRGRSAC